MKRSPIVAVSVLALCFTSVCQRDGGSTSTGPTTSASPLEGVWRLAEVTVTGANPSTAVDPASVFIFAETHYSMMRTVGSQPRMTFAAVNPSSDEKLGAYDSFLANAGTYELSGTTLTVRPIVAKHPNFMAGGFDTYEFRLVGDTLWLTGSSSNIRYRMGDALLADPDPVDETRLKLVRVE